VPLVHQREQVGWVLRTRPGVKPVYVSPGHRVSLESSADLTLRLVTRCRLPEPIRYAHNLASHGVLRG
ncbi:MAG: endonuclease V, partial [Chloroflexaceae bacterium]